MRFKVETLDNIGGRAGIFSRISKVKALAIPVPFIIVLIALHGFVLSPKMKAVKKLSIDVAQKEKQANSMLQTVERDKLLSEEKESWDEVETRILAKLSPYEPLNIMRELAHLAYRARADKIIDVSTSIGQSSEVIAPLEHYLVKISFYTERYNMLLDFLQMMDELRPLVDVESVKLNRQTPGILVEFTLRIYKLQSTNGVTYRVQK